MSDCLENIVWKASHRLLQKVYQETAGFPDDEKFCLTIPLYRSVDKVSMNVVKRITRNDRQSYLRSLYVALSALKETHCFLMLAYDLGYLTDSQWEALSLLVDSTWAVLLKHIGSLKREVGVLGVLCAAVQSTVLTTLSPFYTLAPTCSG